MKVAESSQLKHEWQKVNYYRAQQYYYSWSQLTTWMNLIQAKVSLKLLISCSVSLLIWISTKQIGPAAIHKHSSRLVEQPDIVINNMPLQVTVKQKYLGLIVDNKLSWSSHVSHVCKKMSYYLHLVGLHKHILPASLIKLLMDSSSSAYAVSTACLGSIFVPTTFTTSAELDFKIALYT